MSHERVVVTSSDEQQDQEEVDAAARILAIKQTAIYCTSMVSIASVVVAIVLSLNSKTVVTVNEGDKATDGLIYYPPKTYFLVTAYGDGREARKQIGEDDTAAGVDWRNLQLLGCTCRITNTLND